MRPSLRQHTFIGPSHRLVGIFLVFILLPGVVLGFFALRTLHQKGQLAQQQIKERLERIAAQVGRDLQLQFKQWQEALRSITEEELADSRFWPEMVRLAVEAPVAGVVVFLDGERCGKRSIPPLNHPFAPSDPITCP